MTTTFISKIKKNFSINIIGSILLGLLEIIKIAILTKTLGLDGFGEVLTILNFIMFVVMFFSVRSGDLIMKYYSVYSNNSKLQDLFISMLLIVTFLFAFIIYILLFTNSESIINLFYNNSINIHLFKIYLIVFIFYSFDSFTTGFFRVIDKFSLIYFYKIIVQMITIISLFIYMNYYDYNLEYIIMILTVGTSMMYILPLVKMLTLIKFRFDLQQYKSFWDKEFYDTLLHTFIASFLKITSYPGDIFLLGIFGTNAQVGLYGIARQITQPLMMLSNSLYSAVMPEIISLYNKKKYHNISNFIYSYIGKTIGIAFVVFTVIWLTTDNLILVISSIEFLKAHDLVLILTLTNLTILISLVFYPLALASNKLKEHNLFVSMRILMIIIVYFTIGIDMYSIAIVELIGSIILRIFFDYPLLKSLKGKK